MFFGDDIYLENLTSKHLYSIVKHLPICDYHCHISPQEIAENERFDNIGQMWLSGDHYKWRLMRNCDIDEKYITGDAGYKEKFLKFAEAIENAAGNPLYAWVHFELKAYFGINEPFNRESAPSIWDRANEIIERENLTPKKIIDMSNVAYIGTTDDVLSNLEWHEKIKQDSTFNTKVAPSFRTDNLLMANADSYQQYIKSLAQITSIEIDCLKAFKTAIADRIQYFADRDCKMTDVGIPLFPNFIGNEYETEQAFLKAMKGEKLEQIELEKFIGNMYVFLASEYKKHDMIMQLHLGVKRNANSRMFKSFGPDCGCDTVGNEVNPDSFAALLDRMDKNDALPKTIVYTLSPVNYYALTTIAGSFRNVRMGAAWWFCDHKRGIELQLNTLAELLSLGNSYGMLSDSRSFLSYPRHDYFRRILCNIVGKWVESGEYELKQAEKLVEKISYQNIATEVI